MARIADYLAHTGTGKIMIPTPNLDGNQVVFNFPAMPAGGQETNCLLGMMVSTENANNLKVEGRIGVNGKLIFTYGPSDTNITRFFQRVFDGLSTAHLNPIHLKIVGGTGSFAISNMVLWFQRDI